MVGDYYYYINLNLKWLRIYILNLTLCHNVLILSYKYTFKNECKFES